MTLNFDIRKLTGTAAGLSRRGFLGTAAALAAGRFAFPELAYSWRKVMLPLSAAGFHVIAPDQTPGANGNMLHAPQGLHNFFRAYYHYKSADYKGNKPHLYGRTGFTGALQGYRVRRGSNPKSLAELLTFSGCTIDVPSMFIAGKSDWGVYQTPGAAEKMQTSACAHMVGFHLLDGAGHWVQQEQPEQVSQLLVEFLRSQA